MPRNRRKCKKEKNLLSSPIDKSRRKRPRERIEFQKEWATDLEGRRCRTSELLRANPNPRGSTFTPAGEQMLREILAEICGGRPQSELYTLIEHDWLTIQQIARELLDHAGTITRQYRDEKERIFLRAIRRFVFNA